MQMNGNSQMQRSAAQWHEIVARYRQSGLGRQAFCAAEGLPVATLAKWVSRVRRSEARPGHFIEVAAPAKSSEPWAVEVEFPNGVCLRVRG
jgi:hypothetical protein